MESDADVMIDLEAGLNTELYQIANELEINKLVVIGGGKIALALVDGFVNSGCFRREQVYICTKTEASAAAWRLRGYANSTTSTSFYCTYFGGTNHPKGLILISVKPQEFPTFIDEAKHNSWFPKSDKGTMFVSVMAGISLATLAEKLRILCFNGPVARMMPNLNCTTKNGTLLVCAHQKGELWEHLQQKITPFLQLLGSSVGYCVSVNEKEMDAASSITGCSTAFIYMMIEALADGGVYNGLDRKLALRLAAETVKGSAAHLLASSASPGELKDAVCSPAGTTISGVRELEKLGMRSAFIEAITASTKRSIEIREQSAHAQSHYC